MKFSEMTYVRPDIEAVSKEIKEIIERVKMLSQPESSFRHIKISQKYVKSLNQ